MSRYAWAVVALLVLGGCTSANDMLKHDPVFYGHTDKSPKAYAECVADGWRRDGEKVKVTPIESGYVVSNDGFGGLTAALRVQKWADGKVEIRMSARSSFGSQNLMQAANLCV